MLGPQTQHKGTVYGDDEILTYRSLFQRSFCSWRYSPLPNSNRSALSLAMPVVYVAEPEPRRGRPRKLLQMIVPRLKDADALDYERWDWDELRVDASAIPGCGPMFGLYPRNTEAFSWASLDRTTIVPYLGKETEVESSQLARLLRSSTVGGVQPGAAPASAPAPSQYAPGGSGQLSAPRERPALWARSRCLGRSNGPLPQPPIISAAGCAGGPCCAATSTSCCAARCTRPR